MKCNAVADLGKQLARLARKVQTDIETVTRKAALDMAGSMVQRSPVDTGRFRGNWQYGGDTLNAATDANADVAGAGALGRILSCLSGWRPGQAIYITNSLPYAHRLEYGWSKQAPGGMVRVTVAEYQTYISKAIASVK